MAGGAGVHHFSPHNLRHTLGLWLRAAGVDSATTGAVLGHGDGRMAERTYGRLAKAEDIRSAVGAQYRPGPVACSESTAPSSPAEPAAQAEAPGQAVGFLFGIQGQTGGPGGAGATGKAAIYEEVVPRHGIEPRTRGFSIPSDLPGKSAEPG